MSENRNASEICRFCECCFKVKFGNISQPGKQGHLSSENLFKPSHRKDCRGVILADLCQAVGIALTKDPNTSERVCNPTDTWNRYGHKNGSLSVGHQQTGNRTVH